MTNYDLSPPDGALSTNSTHIAFVCWKIAKPEASAGPPGLPTHPFPLHRHTDVGQLPDTDC